MKTWLRTDEYEEILATLKACRRFLTLVTEDASYWKWVFIALHNAVQGCMVVALTRSDRFGAIDPEQEREWHEAYARKEKLPRLREKLLSFLKLYEKIKKKGTLQSSAVERFKPTGTQGYSMKKLNEVRDDFIHFTPKGWSLELNGAPQLAIDCLEVAAFLVSNSGRFCIFTSFKDGELLGLIRDLQKEFAAVK
jgi:hypothetical protein